MYKLLYIQMKIVHLSGNGRPLHKFRFKLDSGAHGNLIPKSMFERLYPGLLIANSGSQLINGYH